MKYRILSNDVGPHQYSGLCDIEAKNLPAAMERAKQKFSRLPIDPRRADKTLRLLVLPHGREILHDGRTGRIDVMAKQYVVEVVR